LVFVVLIPALAWNGRLWGARARGGFLAASVMQGFGHDFERPAKVAMDAATPARETPGDDSPLEGGKPPTPG